MRWDPQWIVDPQLSQSRQSAEAGGGLEVHVHAAALYVSMIRAGLFEEATEFAEWYLETFDHDLES